MRAAARAGAARLGGDRGRRRGGVPRLSGRRPRVAAGGAQVTHGVDVTATFDTGVASHAHAAYLTGLGDKPMAEPSEFLEAMARATGSRLGCRFGIGFEGFNV